MKDFTEKEFRRYLACNGSLEGTWFCGDKMLTEKEIEGVIRRLKRKCPTCGTVFIPKTDSQRYCKTQCRSSCKFSYWEIFNRDNFQCQYCGRTPTQHGVILHIDHIKPKSDGGDNELSNLVTACSDCNLHKSGRPLLCEKKFKQRLKRKDFITDNQEVFSFIFKHDENTHREYPNFNANK